jgi:Rrf2 family protein
VQRTARSTRFPIAVNIMSMVAFCEDHLEDEYISSGMIAKSVGKNEVVIRRLVASLKEAGLLDSTTGSRGGVKLAREAKDIDLCDVYRAVEPQNTFGMHDCNARCPVARATTNLLRKIFCDAEEGIEDKLRGVTLEDLRGASECEFSEMKNAGNLPPVPTR